MQSPSMLKLLHPLRVPVFILFSCCALAADPAAAERAGTLDTQVADAARRHLLDSARIAGLSDPRVEVSLIGERGAGSGCTDPRRIEPLDARHPGRMRLIAHCADGASVEFVVRAAISANVVVATTTIAAGRPIDATELTLERRTLTGAAEPLSELEAVVGQSSRRALRAGRIVDQRWLVDPVLVRRGATVRIVASKGAVQVSTAGDALESGRRGEIVGVRNAATGGVIQARVVAGNMVEPVVMP